MLDEAFDCEDSGLLESGLGMCLTVAMLKIITGNPRQHQPLNATRALKAYGKKNSIYKARY
ncbi:MULTISPECIES: hypothetical protein [Pseudomonas]|uniref:hypothetical protein n=1 Tax=Pseudomonas TaxID=286 RepID=UPI0011136E72|nr:MULTISPECIES: hypothetical protein [Pseudomonas]